MQGVRNLLHFSVSHLDSDLMFLASLSVLLDKSLFNYKMLVISATVYKLW